jgi:hypothetical protein
MITKHRIIFLCFAVHFVHDRPFIWPVRSRSPAFRKEFSWVCELVLFPPARVRSVLRAPPSPGTRVVPPSQRRFAPLRRCASLLGTPPSGSSHADGSLVLPARFTTASSSLRSRPLQRVASRGFGSCRGSSRAGHCPASSSESSHPPDAMGLVTSLRSVATASLLPWYPSTAAVASTAPSADSAMTAYSASFGSTVVFASFVDSMLSSHTVTFRLARARSPVECGRPPTGGPVRSDSGKN